MLRKEGLGLAGLVCFLAAAAAAAAAAATPARRLSGSIPALPLNATGWTESELDVLVDAGGLVSDIKSLRATPSTIDTLAQSVANWRFAPATADGRPISAHVFIAAIFRPPMLGNGPAIGSPSRQLATPSDTIPFAIETPRPLYPALGVGNGVVLVEVLVNSTGLVTQARAIGPSSGFDRSAIAAAQRWSFRPARQSGARVRSYAYLIFGFRQPA